MKSIAMATCALIELASDVGQELRRHAILYLACASSVVLVTSDLVRFACSCGFIPGLVIAIALTSSVILLVGLAYLFFVFGPDRVRLSTLPGARAIRLRRRRLGGIFSGDGCAILLVIALSVMAIVSFSCVSAGDDIPPVGYSPSVSLCGEPPEPVFPYWHSSPSGLEIMMSLDSAQIVHDWYRDSARWMSCARTAR
jgi:hypothetical protein